MKMNWVSFVFDIVPAHLFQSNTCTCIILRFSFEISLIKLEITLKIVLIVQYLRHNSWGGIESTHVFILLESSLGICLCSFPRTCKIPLSLGGQNMPEVFTSWP